MNLQGYIIAIPAYNEADFIGQVITDIKRHMPAIDIVVINDGSTDRTSEIAREQGVMVLDIPFNIGYGGATQTGFRFALEEGYDFVITIDADNQHDPASIVNLINAMHSQQADAVIGSRFLEGNYRMGLFRRIGSYLFAKIAKAYTGVEFTDPTSGFQLLSRKVFSYLAVGDNYPLDYPDVNIIMALYKMRFKVVEAPVVMREKRGGKSMHSGLRPVIYVIRMFLAILMVLLRKED